MGNSLNKKGFLYNKTDYINGRYAEDIGEIVETNTNYSSFLTFTNTYNFIKLELNKTSEKRLRNQENYYYYYDYCGLRPLIVFKE